MRRNFLLLGLLFILLTCASASAYTTTYQVKKTDIYSGNITEQIWLNAYAMPEITISDIKYEANVDLPKGAKPSDPAKLFSRLGMERKKPFVAVNIPAY